jgi:hypothetical protein
MCLPAALPEAARQRKSQPEGPAYPSVEHSFREKPPRGNGNLGVPADHSPDSCLDLR